MRKFAAAAMGAALAVPGLAAAQIAVSAADGKQVRPTQDASTRTQDQISTIDLRRYPPKVLATIDAPTSMIGPPAAVAVARNGGFALITSAQRIGPGGDLVLNETVSVVDLANPAAPKVIQTVQAGPGASGVTINRAGTIALVASTGDDAISIFTIKGKSLTPAGRVQLEAKARPTDVVFAPSGRSAMVVAQGASLLVPLAATGNAVRVAGQGIATGTQPYGAVYSPDGRFIYNTNLGGRPVPAGNGTPAGRRPGTVAATEVATGRTESVEVGQTPEHVALSSDGRFAAVVVANGTGAALGYPGDYGLLQVYAVKGTTLTKLDEAHTAGWCQGAVFDAHAQTVALQCAATKQIEVYRFDGRKLTRDEDATLQFDARPGSLATAISR